MGNLPEINTEILVLCQVREDIPANSNSRTFILKANFEFEFYHADKASTLMYMRTYVQGNNKKI